MIQLLISFFILFFDTRQFSKSSQLSRGGDKSLHIILQIMGRLTLTVEILYETGCYGW